MESKEIEQKWQTALRKYFPGVIVRKSPPLPIPAIDNEDLYDLFMVPDDRKQEFIDFTLNERWRFREIEQLPDIELLHHYESVTREYYPRIWEEAQREKRVGVGKKKLSKSRKTAPQQTVARARGKKSLAPVS